MRERSRKWDLTRQMFGCILFSYVLVHVSRIAVPDASENTQLTIKLATDMLEEVKAHCRQDGVTVSFVIRAALRDYLRYGLEVRIRREPPEEEKTESIF